MCYGMGCSKESQGTGTCTDPHLCTFEQEQEMQNEVNTMQRKTNFYCPNCEDDHKRNYLTHDRGIWRCLECGEVYTTATLREAYEDEYEGLIADAEWIKDSMLDGLEELDQSKVAA